MVDPVRGAKLKLDLDRVLGSPVLGSPLLGK
jgi:hypothetical protein